MEEDVFLMENFIISDILKMINQKIIHILKNSNPTKKSFSKVI